MPYIQSMTRKKSADDSLIIPVVEVWFLNIKFKFLSHKKAKEEVIHKIHKDKRSQRMKQFYSNTFRRITPSSVGKLIELNVEASLTICLCEFCG